MGTAGCGPVVAAVPVPAGPVVLAVPAGAEPAPWLVVIVVAAGAVRTGPPARVRRRRPVPARPRIRRPPRARLAAGVPRLGSRGMRRLVPGWSQAWRPHRLGGMADWRCRLGRMRDRRGGSGRRCGSVDWRCWSGGGARPAGRLANHQDSLPGWLPPHGGNQPLPRRLRGGLAARRLGLGLPGAAAGLLRRVLGRLHLDGAQGAQVGDGRVERPGEWTVERLDQQLAAGQHGRERGRRKRRHPQGDDQCCLAARRHARRSLVTKVQGRATTGGEPGRQSSLLSHSSRSLLAYAMPGGGAWWPGCRAAPARPGPPAG